MLSTPVCGVETKNEVVALLFAPFLYREVATGITPHEHSGSGIPNIDALIIGNNPFPAKCFSIVAGDINVDNTPAIKNPKIKKGAI